MTILVQAAYVWTLILEADQQVLTASWRGHCYIIPGYRQELCW